MVVDVTIGVTEEDLAAAKVIRRAGRPVRVVVNKVDDANRDAAAWEFVSLGLGDPSPSAPCTGAGPATCSTRWCASCPHRCEEPADGRIGHFPMRPPSPGRRGSPSSAGPMSGSRRSSTSCSARSAPSSTTCRAPRRDAIDTVVDTPDGPVCFIDTAGLRRPSKTDRGTEQHSTMRALRALERADVALLVIDATVGASHQDQRLAERIGVSGCPAIVALNKWDLVPTDDRDDVLAGVGDRLAFLGSAPVLKISALVGQGRAPDPPGAARLPWRPITSGSRPGPSTGPCRSSRCRQAAPRCQDPLHRPGGHRSAHLHPLHERAPAARPTSATSSAACARSSISAQRR